jgi:imidazoleglycerol-phosphate dehydratase
MDEALVLTALDLSGRPYLAYAWKPRQPYVEHLEAGLIKEFFRALVTHAGMNLHLKVMAGENSHHIVEAMFKGLGRALRMAVSPEGDGKKVPSTKGIL